MIDQADVERLLATSRGARRLSLDEVRQSGLPALFLDYGEVLLYLDDQLFCLRDVVSHQQESAPPPPLPAHVLNSGVGIEYGWRHLTDRACPVCLELTSVEERQQRAA